MQTGPDEETLLYYGSSSSSSWRGERHSEMAAVTSETLLPVNEEIEIVFPTPTGSSQNRNTVGCVCGAERNNGEQCIAERNVQYLSTFIQVDTTRL